MKEERMNFINTIKLRAKNNIKKIVLPEASYIRKIEDDHTALKE